MKCVLVRCRVLAVWSRYERWFDLDIQPWQEGWRRSGGRLRGVTPSVRTHLSKSLFPSAHAYTPMQHTYGKHISITPLLSAGFPTSLSSKEKQRDEHTQMSRWNKASDTTLSSHRCLLNEPLYPPKLSSTYLIESVTDHEQCHQSSCFVTTSSQLQSHTYALIFHSAQRPTF